MTSYTVQGMAYSVVIDSDVIHCARRADAVLSDGDGLVDKPGMVNIVDVVRVVCVARYLTPAVENSIYKTTYKSS